MNIALFASGSSGNCALVSDGDTHLLLDAGISARRIRAGLSAQDVTADALTGVLVTHEHSDHVKGLAVLLRHDPVPVYALPAVCAALRAQLPAECLHEIAPDAPFFLGDVRVTPFATPHDAAGSCGYRIDGSAHFGLCTDLGVVTDTVRAALAGVDCAVIEANHDPELLRTGPYPAYLKRRIASDHGHLSNESAGALAVFLAENGAQQLILGHLSRENNTPRAALDAVSQALTDAGFLPVSSRSSMPRRPIRRSCLRRERRAYAVDNAPVRRKDAGDLLYLRVCGICQAAGRLLPVRIGGAAGAASA